MGTSREPVHMGRPVPEDFLLGPESFLGGMLTGKRQAARYELSGGSLRLIRISERAKVDGYADCKQPTCLLIG